jgi:hypothetical protein
LAGDTAAQAREPGVVTSEVDEVHPQVEDDAASLSGRAFVVALVVGLGALAVIRTTLMPGLGFWDTGEAQTVGPVLGTMHPTGFPAYVILGWLATIVLSPFGDPAFGMNLLSAILVAAAAGGTVLVARRIGVPLVIAAAAGLALALTPIAWKIGTSADAHALHIALVVGIVLLLLTWERRLQASRSAGDASGSAGMPVRHGAAGTAASTRSADRWLIAAAALFGVSMANHSLTLLLVVPVGLYVLAVDPRVLLRPRTVAFALGACIGVAVLLYLQLPLRAGPFRAPLVYGRPDTWDGFWYVVLAEQFRGSIVAPFDDLGRKAADLVDLASRQLGPLVVLVPAAFLATLRWAPRYALLSGTAVAITVFFSASYQNADIGRYYLGPAFFAWTWLALLASVLAQVIGDLTSGMAWVRGRDAVVAAGVAALLLVPTAAALPERHADLDRSDNVGARQWLDAAFASMDEDALVLSWWSYSTALWYGQHVEGRRPDIRIVDDRTLLDEELGEVGDVIDAQLGLRPVYVIRASDRDIAQLQTRFLLEPLAEPGNIYRVTGRRDDAG